MRKSTIQKEKELRAQTLLPQGEYHAELERAIEKSGNKAGPRLCLLFRILGPSCRDAVVWANFYLQNPDETKKLKSLKVFQRLLAAAGTGKNGKWSWEELYGKAISISVLNSSFKGKQYSNISRYQPISQLSALAPMPSLQMSPPQATVLPPQLTDTSELALPPQGTGLPQQVTQVPCPPPVPPPVPPPGDETITPELFKNV